MKGISMLHIKKISILFISFLFISCQKSSDLRLYSQTTSPPPLPPPPSSDFGACQKGECKKPFCAENCKVPSECHVKDVEGVCRPSCGYAAHLVGWGNYGPDKIQGTSDDIHIYEKSVSCEALSITYPDGIVRDDWISFEFHHNVTPYEIIENGGFCCIRGESAIPQPSHTETPSATDENH